MDMHVGFFWNKDAIDCIMVRNIWRNSTKNYEAYNSFSSIESDHRILTGKIKLSLRVTKRQKSQPIGCDYINIRLDTVKRSKNYTGIYSQSFKKILRTKFISQVYQQKSKHTRTLLMQIKRYQNH